MKKRMMLFLCVAAVSCALVLPVPETRAANYPDRPINLIIPAPPGSLIDVSGRILCEELGKVLGVKVIPMNKPGASFMLGTDFVARSKKDGYTLAYTNSAAIVNSRVVEPEMVPYDPDKDLDPLGVHVFFPHAIGVQEESPWKTFQELADYAKKDPGKLRASTAGKFPAAFFFLKIVESLTGAKFTQVPYKGGEQVITALLGGHVETSFDAAIKFVPHIKAGKLRVLLVDKKINVLPEVPTLTDAGYKQEGIYAWFAFYGPSGMPEEVKKVLVPAIQKAVNEPESKAKIEKMGFTLEYKSPEEQKKLAAVHFKNVSDIMAKFGGSK